MPEAPSPDITKFNHASRGILPSVIPGQRMHTIVDQDIDGCPDAAKSGDEQAQRPKIGTVSW